MELAVLAARIHAGGEIVEQPLVEPSPGERTVELPRIDARDDRLKARGDELARETGRVPVPEWKAGSLGEGGQTVFAVGPDILEEQVAERDRFDVS